MVLINKEKLTNWATNLIPVNKFKREGIYKGAHWSLTDDNKSIVMELRDMHLVWNREIAMKYLGVVSRNPEWDIMRIIDYHFQQTSIGLKRRNDPNQQTTAY